MSGITWDYVLKFIITGDAAVGKSSLLIQLTDQRFLANPDPTLGVEFGSKLITIPEENKIVKLQCWDTAGTESFRSITRSYYRGAAGCLLVYDVTSRKSFTNARSWLADVREHADPHLTCILVGNKVDLVEGEEGEEEGEASNNTFDLNLNTSSSNPNPNTTTTPSSAPSNTPVPAPNPRLRRREVPLAEARLFASEENLLFVEASAKSGHNVEAAFVTAARDILGKIRGGVFDEGRSPGVKLSKPNGNNNNNNLALDQRGAKQSCCS